MILYFNKLPSIKILGLYDYDCPQTIIENVPEDYGRYPHQDDCTIYHACYKVSSKYYYILKMKERLMVISTM